MIQTAQVKKTTAAKTTLLTASQFIKELTALKTKHPSDNSKHFAGTDKSNAFLNVRMGAIFALAKTYMQMPVYEIEKLLANKHYEVRMGAVSIMDFQARDKKISTDQKKVLFDLYIQHHDRINNWDLVDRSAIYVVGGHLYDKPRGILYQLARSKNEWERRTAIVSTYYFIRQNEVDDTFKIAEILVHDKHELVNKAVGSWVREAGKKDKKRLLAFLEQYAATMPRITLRYAIEKLDKKQREYYMKMDKK